MSDLKIDYDLLSDTITSLSSIHRELGGLEARVGDADDVWGSDEIADRMSDFGGNWSYHRGKLMGAVEATGQMCQGALDGFRSTDAGLARSFDRPGGR